MKVRATSLSPRLQRLVGRNSSCSPQAASKLTQKTKTGSNIDAAVPQLRREFQRLQADFRYGDRDVPGKREKRRGLTGLPERNMAGAAGVPTEGLRRMKAGTDRREFRKVRPSKLRKGRGGRPWSKGSPEALSAGCNPMKAMVYATGSEGTRKRAADVRVGWSPGGPDSKSKHPWGGRGGGPQGSGPSAAVRSLAPEERRVEKVRSGTHLARRRQWASALSEPFSFGAFGLLGSPPHSHLQSSNYAEVIFASGTGRPPGGERSVLSWRGGRLRAAGTGAYRYNDLRGAWLAVPTTPDDLCPPERFRVILKAQTYCLRPEGSLPRNEYRPQPRTCYLRLLNSLSMVRKLTPEERGDGGIS